MTDNVFIWILSSVCIVLILAEWLLVSHRKSALNAIVFLCYSLPLYYLMYYRGSGGAAFTWWFYLVIITSVHILILLLQIIIYRTKKKQADKSD